MSTILSLLANCVYFSLQMHMFIARYCDLLNVDISCDGCDEIAPWHRYRCLQCSDMDLCKTCFLGKPQGMGSYAHKEVISTIYDVGNLLNSLCYVESLVH